ncbi:hypothetical protein JTE90_006695 [Oedothorax gibbosus]|uniref:LAGLIDADG endonuclease n=1 Tax=Oedothorax gibbosus TaxID=931172 RepID=A0AAV6TUQ1_9ARAC|nr:hypothetical protein JTE90_006695 [Oedothorax gibbosus]
MATAAMVLSRRHNVYKIVSVWHSLVKHNIYICSIDKGINSVWHSLVKSIYIDHTNCQRSTKENNPDGNSLFNNENAYLIVEKTVIGDLCPVTDILPLYFSSFYVLNIKYPAKASATMEFLQRLILNINPSGIGNRRGAARNRTKVHPKVMTLIGRLQKDESVWEVNEM